MSSSQVGPQKRKPPNTSFHQQKIRAYRPILTPIPVILLYVFIGVIFAIIGIFLFLAWGDTVETEHVRYDDTCHLNTTCAVKINITEKMISPVFFYYKIENHYQNYRLYVRARSDYQLRGQSYAYTDLSPCAPKITKGDTGKDKDIFLPCGLPALDFFNDTFIMVTPTGKVVNWSSKNIAWFSELKYKFKRIPPQEPGIRIYPFDVKNHDFIVWMRISTFPDFRKLYRVIHHDLDVGTYTVYINNTWDVDPWDGSKFVLLSTTTWIGGQNLGIAIAYIVVAFLSFLLATAFAIKAIVAPRSLGDHSKFHWFQK